MFYNICVSLEHHQQGSRSFTGPRQFVADNHHFASLDAEMFEVGAVVAFSVFIHAVFVQHNFFACFGTCKHDFSQNYSQISEPRKVILEGNRYLYAFFRSRSLMSIFF